MVMMMLAKNKCVCEQIYEDLEILAEKENAVLIERQSRSHSVRYF